jgi:hypothetical protein
MVILYKLTSRSRPAKMYKAYKSVVDNAVLNWVMILSVDSDDAVTLNSDEFKQMQWDKRVSIHVGTSKNKIDAINRDVPQSGWDILVNLSDDQVFTVKGFDKVIAEHCGNDTFLHLPDGYVNERLATMSIMGIDYYKRFGYIYHPDYVSLFCDNEAMDEAIRLGCYKYVNTNVFIHDHPAWTGATPDAQLLHTQSFYRRDERVYKKRKSLNFPINSVYS